MKRDKRLIRIATIIILLELGCYPFLPEFAYLLNQKKRDQLSQFVNELQKDQNSISTSTKSEVLGVTSQSSSQNSTENSTLPKSETESTSQKTTIKKPVTGDRVIIPSIGLEYKMIVGGSEKALDTAIWAKTKLKPEGNTVITGHRFGWVEGPGPFYHLPKVKVGDKIVLIIKNRSYFYKVIDKKIVTADATWVERDTKKEMITLYTCDTLLASKRYVILASPV
ncbi:MAG: hypothetical protein Fur003_4980 [Candidatus Dojkabacteria bacterium]